MNYEHYRLCVDLCIKCVYIQSEFSSYLGLNLEVTKSTPKQAYITGSANRDQFSSGQNIEMNVKKYSNPEQLLKD